MMKNTFRAILIFALITAIVPMAAHANIPAATAPPSADTCINSAQASTPQNAAAQFSLQFNTGGTSKYAILKFDIKSILQNAEYKIESLKFKGRITGSASAPTFSIYRISSNWDDTKITYNSQYVTDDPENPRYASYGSGTSAAPAAETPISSASLESGATGPIEFDLTGYLNKPGVIEDILSADDGVLSLKITCNVNEGTLRMATSKAAVEANRPYLDFSYKKLEDEMLHVKFLDADAPVMNQLIPQTESFSAKVKFNTTKAYNDEMISILAVYKDGVLKDVVIKNHLSVQIGPQYLTTSSIDLSGRDTSGYIAKLFLWQTLEHAIKPLTAHSSIGEADKAPAVVFDFDCGNEGFVANTATGTLSANLGIAKLTVIADPADAARNIRLEDKVKIDPAVYKFIKIRMKQSKKASVTLYFAPADGNYTAAQSVLIGDGSVSWTEYTVDLSANDSWGALDSGGLGTIERLRLDPIGGNKATDEGDYAEIDYIAFYAENPNQ